MRGGEGMNKTNCEGPQGVKGAAPSHTTKRGNESGRTVGSKQQYKETGKPGSGKK